MDENRGLAEKFEGNRGHLRAVAYRMLGSLSEADDAVQETWLRLSRSGSEGIENLSGWLTTVTARVCLDMLRSRRARREEPVTKPEVRSEDPEQEMLLADSVGLALLVVLDRLTPGERLAFVLHDLFGVSFEEVAVIVGRTPEAARQLASRARRRVKGGAPPEADLAAQRRLIETFLSALRAGDLEGVVAVLDPDFVIHTDRTSTAPGKPSEVRGAREWAKQAIQFGPRGAVSARLAIVNGSVGLIFAPRGHLSRVLTLAIVDDKIARIEVIGDPERLEKLELAVLEN